MLAIPEHSEPQKKKHPEISRVFWGKKNMSPFEVEGSRRHRPTFGRAADQLLSRAVGSKVAKRAWRIMVSIPHLQAIKRQFGRGITLLGGLTSHGY